MQTTAALIIALVFTMATSLSAASSPTPVNITNIGPKSLSLHLNFTSSNAPVSLTNFTTAMQLRATTSNAASSTINLDIANVASLNSNDINATLLPSSGTSPLSSLLRFIIAPSTPSGTYYAIVSASAPGFAQSNFTVSLSVYNPTNTSYVTGNSLSNSTALVYIYGIGTTVNNMTTTVPQSQQTGGQIALAVVIAIVAIAAYVLYRNRKSGV